MSGLYSTALKTRYFDPRVNIANNICEFRLDPNTAFYPNLKLAGLGVSISGGTPQSYNLGAGAYGILKRISLFDGRVELDKITEANRFLAFVNANNSNKDNININGAINSSQNGYLLCNNAEFRTAGNLLYETKTSASLADDNERQHSSIDLRLALPLLRNLSYLDTSLIKNLRIEIEFETDIRKILAVDNVTQTTLRPSLIADEIRDPAIVAQLRKNQQAVVWNAIEHDQFTISSGVTVATALGNTEVSEQETSAIVNGFDNKFVERVVISKTFSDPASNIRVNVINGFGAYRALNQLRCKEQYRINGVNRFGGDGIISDSQRLLLLCNTWGDVNVPPFGHRQSVGLDEQHADRQNNRGVLTATNTNGNDNRQNGLVGQFAFTGFQVNERVNQFNVNIKRSLINSATDQHQINNLGLTVHIHAEVRKGIQFGANDYNVKYL